MPQKGKTAQKKKVQQQKPQVVKQRIEQVPEKPQSVQQGKKVSKPDIIFVLPEDEQEKFQKECYERRAAKNKSCLDPHETRQRDNFAPQEVPAINKVSQKIVIEQESSTPDSQLFTLNEIKKPLNQVLNKPCIISIKPKMLIKAEPKLDAMDMEEAALEELNRNINHQRHFLLGVPKTNNYQPEQSLTTERNSTTKNKKQMELDTEIAPPKLSKAMNTKLESMIKCYDSLLEATIPEEISCRDQEKELITKFIQEGIKNDGQSQALYISGVPGVGKTATVLEVQKKLAQKQSFQFIHVNAMNFNLPDNIYTILLEQITGIKDASKSQACIILTELFMKGTLPANYKAYEKKMQKKNRVLLLDECDNLFTPDQQVLYNLVDWPQQKHAKLTVIMIANTMDFPERLKPKLQSRLGNHRVVFKPYTSAQIETILQQRMKEKKYKDIFAANTLNYLGKKIATISTDIRKTLCVCRMAIQIAQEELKSVGQFKQIEVNHVKMAYERVYNKAYHICLQYFNRSLKLLLITIALEIHLKGYNVAYLTQVQQRFNQIFIQNKEEPITYDELVLILMKLRELNIVEIKEHPVLLTKVTWQSKLQESLEKDKLKNINDVAIQLKINVDDIKNGLANDSLFQQYSHFF